MGMVSNWIKDHSQEMAEDLSRINESELFKKNIAGFGMREKVIENLKELRDSGFYDRCDRWLQEANRKYGINITKEDVRSCETFSKCEGEQHC